MKIPILMYHSVSDSDDYRDLPPSCRPIGYRLKVRAFEEHLAGLREGGWETISLQDLLDYREGRGELPEKAVILTYDDGYADNYHTVLPLLLKYGFTATFFLSVSYLGEFGMMDLSDAGKLLEAGMEIGSHGMGHDLLTGRGKEELRWELEESRRRLRERLPAGIDFFSLPRGYLPPALPALARAAGYRGLCTSRPGFNSDQTDLFALRRFPVRSDWGREELEAILSGKGRLSRRIILIEQARALLRKRFHYKIFAGQKFYLSLFKT